jgi:hypothetical protein
MIAASPALPAKSLLNVEVLITVAYSTNCPHAAFSSVKLSPKSFLQKVLLISNEDSIESKVAERQIE